MIVDITKMVDSKRLAKMLNISVNTVKVRLSKGTIPPPDYREHGVLYWHKHTLGASLK